MDNVQKRKNFINIPSSRTFRSVTYFVNSLSIALQCTGQWGRKPELLLEVSCIILTPTQDTCIASSLQRDFWSFSPGSLSGDGNIFLISSRSNEITVMLQFFISTVSISYYYVLLSKINTVIHGELLKKEICKSTLLSFTRTPTCY
jgi:hypothetical protein